tara:strand:- start:148 stop:516 length:369 start_codon:yes stop_codon:yes gene_type:complete
MHYGKILILLSILILIPASLFAQSKDDLKKAISYYNKGNYSEAVTLFDLYLKNKSDPKVYYLRGYALYKMSEFNEALNSFKTGYIIDPKATVSKSTDVLSALEKPSDPQVLSSPGKTTLQTK